MVKAHPSTAISCVAAKKFKGKKIIINTNTSGLLLPKKFFCKIKIFRPEVDEILKYFSQFFFQIKLKKNQF